MWYVECPICRETYEHNPRVCSCGFEGLLSNEIFTPRNEAEKEREELFSIFKFAKHVLYGKIPYRETVVFEDEYADYTLVDAAIERRGLAVVNCVGAPPTVTHDGLFAFESSVRALILNTNTASPLFLDESFIKILLLGPDFGGFEEGFLRTFRPLRYLAVHGDNKHFTGEDNVLFDKKKERLISYAALKPEETYTVPSSVKVLTRRSFCNPRHLKTLYIPHGVRREKGWLTVDEQTTVDLVEY